MACVGYKKGTWFYKCTENMCNSSQYHNNNYLLATGLIPFEEKEVDEISDPLSVKDLNLFFSGQMVQNICVSFHSRIARLVNNNILIYRSMNMVQSHSTIICLMDVVQHNHQTLISLLGSIQTLILQLTTTVNQLIVTVQGMIVGSEKGNFILKNS